jgi:hypothetical protein
LSIAEGIVDVAGRPALEVSARVRLAEALLFGCALAAGITWLPTVSGLVSWSRPAGVELFPDGLHMMARMTRC